MCGEINNTIFDLHWTFNIISASAYGVLAPGSAHARPSAQSPIDTSRISRRTCLQSHLQTSPPPLKTHISKPYNNSFLVKIIFWTLKNSRTAPSVRKVWGAKEKKKQISLKYWTLCSAATPRAAHALRSDQFNDEMTGNGSTFLLLVYTSMCLSWTQ